MKSPSLEPGAQPVATPRFHWIMGLLALMLAGGVVQDIWAHNHGRVDQSFYTPWHAILYSSMAIVGIFLGGVALLNLRKGYNWRRSLPPAYMLTLIGVALFALCGALDLLWHTFFGIEVSTEALLSPTHLILLTAGLLIVTGPLRAAWLAFSPASERGWPTLGPMLLSAAATIVLLGMFTQFASPMVDTFAAKDPSNLPVFTDIFVMNRNGSEQTRITVQPDMLHYGPAWSPDGRRLVFMIRPGTIQNGELFVAAPNGSHLRQLTHNGRKNYYARWSPDGRHIAFNSQRGINTQTSEIYVIDTDGSNQRALTSGDTESYHPAWSPDGKHIVFASKRDGTWRLYRMNADGSDEHVLPTATDANEPDWSRDGKSVAYVAEPDGTSQVAVMPATGGPAKTVGPANGSDPAWSPDSRWLALTAPAGSGSDIYLVSASGGAPVDLTNDRGIETSAPLWSPDGKRIAYSGIGHNGRIRPGTAQSFGVAGVIIQTVLLMSIALLLLHVWSLPFGAMTLLFGLPSIAQLIMADNYQLAAGAVLTGLIADVIVLRLRAPLGGTRLYIFAAVVPAIYQAAILSALGFTAGLGWSVNMIGGSVLYASATGLFLAFMLDWPVTPERRQEVKRA